MIREEEVYRIGRMGKAHGVKGEISFLFDDDIFDRADADYIVLGIDGILVPFFIEEYRFKSDTNALMKFEGVDSMERAKELTGCEVYFPRELSDDYDDHVSWAKIIGYKLVDAGTGIAVGTISSVDDTTLNTLFQLSDGRLIPASEYLIQAIDTKEQRIDIKLPEGILEL